MPADPLPPKSGALAGVLTPHIDFRVSLRSYAKAFRPLLDAPLPETWLILGVGHRSRLEWNLDRRDYETPLGRAICATDLVDQLADGFDARRLLLPNAHEGEHSIEFPLVWLQGLHRLHPEGKGKPVRFIPLLCGALQSYVDGAAEWNDLRDFHHLARALGQLFEKHPPGKQLGIIVSIDGCHLGPRFDHPFRVTPALLKATAGWEDMLWTLAEKGDVTAFLDWFRVEGNDRYFDGVGALALLLAAGGGRIRPQRTHYEQWFAKEDASAVTFSSGLILL